MFVTVKYGDDRTRLFNANCRIDILLHYIKVLCNCNEQDVVDVSDERGVIKNLRNFPLDYASDYLKDRETLILIKVEKLDTTGLQSDRSTFVPMLWELRNDREFIDALHSAHDEDQESVASPRKSPPQLFRRTSAAVMPESEDLKNAKAAKVKNGTLANQSKKSLARRNTKPQLKK